MRERAEALNQQREGAKAPNVFPRVRDGIPESMFRSPPKALDVRE
jgi:hypothetical protein